MAYDHHCWLHCASRPDFTLQSTRVDCRARSLQSFALTHFWAFGAATDLAQLCTSVPEAPDEAPEGQHAKSAAKPKTATKARASRKARGTPTPPAASSGVVKKKTASTRRADKAAANAAAAAAAAAHLQDVNEIAAAQEGSPAPQAGHRAPDRRRKPRSQVRLLNSSSDTRSHSYSLKL